MYTESKLTFSWMAMVIFRGSHSNVASALSQLIKSTRWAELKLPLPSILARASGNSVPLEWVLPCLFGDLLLLGESAKQETIIRCLSTMCQALIRVLGTQ